MTKQRRGEDACLGERDLERLLGGGEGDLGRRLEPGPFPAALFL